MHPHDMRPGMHITAVRGRIVHKGIVLAVRRTGPGATVLLAHKRARPVYRYLTTAYSITETSND